MSQPETTCDDAEVMCIWRECGLPEYFLGNGGTNHKLVEFARRLRQPIRVERERLRVRCDELEEGSASVN